MGRTRGLMNNQNLAYEARGDQSTQALPRVYLLCIICLHCITLFLFFRPAFFIDGYPYMYWGHSLVFDRDVNMFNQFVLVPSHLDFYQPNSNGYLSNTFPMGHSLLYLPGLLLAFVSGKIYSLFQPVSTTLGYGFCTYFLYLIQSFGYALAGNITLFFVLARVNSPRSAFVASTCITFGTTVFGYAYLIPSYSHCLSFFLCTILLYIWSRRGTKLPTRTYGYAIVLAVLFLVRYQNLILLLIPLYDLYHRGIWQKKILLFKAALLSWILISPQLLANWIIEGKPGLLTSRGLAEYFYGFSLNTILFFIHPQNGLFTLTPLTLLALVGLLVAVVKKERHHFLFALIIIITFVQITTRVDLFHGEAYGMRRFTSMMALSAFGLAFLLENARRRHNVLLWITEGCSIVLTIFYVLKLSLVDAKQIVYTGHIRTDIIKNLFFYPSFEAVGNIIQKGLYFSLQNKLVLSSNLPRILLALLLATSFGILLYLFRYTLQNVFKRFKMVIGICLVLLLLTIMLLPVFKTQMYVFFPVDYEAYLKKKKRSKTSAKYKRHLDQIQQKRKQLKVASPQKEMYQLSLNKITDFTGERFNHGYRFKSGLNYTKKLPQTTLTRFVALVLCTRTTRQEIKLNKENLMKNLSDLEVRVNGEQSAILTDTKMLVTPTGVLEPKFFIRVIGIYDLGQSVSVQTISLQGTTKKPSFRLTGLCFESL